MGERMRTSHKLLLRLYHDPSYDFSSVRVEYVNRGAPGDCSEIQGDWIDTLNSWYMEVNTGDRVTHIPYHRIIRIFYGDKVAWKRGDRLANKDEG